MNPRYHKRFRKQFLDLNGKQQRLFEERISLFGRNPQHPQLNNHALQGRYAGFRSINVGGDLRAVFEQSGRDVLFVAIGTHSQLYG